MGCFLGGAGIHHANVCQKVWPYHSGPNMPWSEIPFSGDVTKCAETLQKLISTRREHGTRQQVGVLDATFKYLIEATLHAGSGCPLVLASRLVIVCDIVKFITAGPNQPDCISNI